MKYSDLTAVTGFSAIDPPCSGASSTISHKKFVKTKHTSTIEMRDSIPEQRIPSPCFETKL